MTGSESIPWRRRLRTKILLPSIALFVIFAVMVIWNFIPSIPKKLPARMFYSLLLKKMKEPAYVPLQGAIGIDFCWYLQDECPFGAEYCDCRDRAS